MNNFLKCKSILKFLLYLKIQVFKRYINTLKYINKDVFKKKKKTKQNDCLFFSFTSKI
jgi:hypothetical protein